MHHETRPVRLVPVDVLHLAKLGEQDRAIDLLGTAVDDRVMDALTMPKSHPWFDPLRTDPRFIALMRRMGLQ